MKVNIIEYDPDLELEWLDVHATIMVDSAAWWTVLHKKPVYELPTVDLVALIEGKIVGFIVIEINPEMIKKHHPAGFVWEFGVQRNYRGNDIGREMITEAHRIMKRKYSVSKSLWYSQEEKAQNYYRKLGMKEIGRHWQFSVVPEAKLKKELMNEGFNCWTMRGSCEIKDFDKVKKKFRLVWDDYTLKPRICIGFEFIL